MLQRTFDEHKLSSDPDLLTLSPVFTLRESIQILLRRRWIVIGSVVTIVSSVAAFIAIATPLYTATSTLLIDPRRSQATQASDQVPNYTSYSPVVDNEVLVITSKAVLQPVVEKLKLDQDPEFKPQSSWYGFFIGLLNLGQKLPSQGPQGDLPGQSPEDLAKAKTIDALQRRLRVERQSTSFVITVSATSEIPQKAAKIANAVVDAYFSETVRNYNNMSKIAASWFNQQLDDLKERERVLQDRLVHPPASNDSGATVRLRELVRELSVNRAAFESLLTRYRQSTAKGDLQLPDMRILATADIPSGPSFPKPLLFFALALPIGLAFGVGIAFAVDFLDNRVKTPHQAEAVTNLPTLAMIPTVSARELARHAGNNRKKVKGVNEHDFKTTELLVPALQPPLMRYVLEKPSSLFAEGVRAIRLAVQRGANTKSIKLVLVSSSISGEGKTTLAVNLALSLATVGMRTILLDGDLRNPEMTRSLCPKARYGLIEVATGRVPIESALLVDKPTGLFVMPSLSRSAHFVNENEFVFSHLMVHLLENLRKHFDFVIVDAPPIIPLVEARALAEIADSIVLAIRFDATAKDVVAQSLGALAPVRDRLLGTVLTRVDLRRLRYYGHGGSTSLVGSYSYLDQHERR
jgi:capsular exopolysaccharide synthesis family protein